MSTKIITLPNVRLYWSDLFTKAKDTQDKATGRTILGKYGCTVIIDPASPAGAAVQAAVNEVAFAEFGKNFAVILGAMDAKKQCLRDGDKYLDAEGEVRPDFAGQKYLAAKNDVKPVVIAYAFHNGKPVVLSADGGTFQDGVPVAVPFEAKAPYRGCFVNVKVSIDAFTSKNAEVGRMVAAKILAVQFAKDGDAFGSAPPTADGFADLGANTSYDPLGAF